MAQIDALFILLLTVLIVSMPNALASINSIDILYYFQCVLALLCGCLGLGVGGGAVVCGIVECHPWLSTVRYEPHAVSFFPGRSECVVIR